MPYGTYDPYQIEIPEFCERALIESGRRIEAYEQYALSATPLSTYLAHFRSLVRRYPEYEPEQILIDLIDKSGLPLKSWFSWARQCELYDLALQCVTDGPISPNTIATAARDTLELHPEFAWEFSLLAIKYLLVDYLKFDDTDVRIAVRNLVIGAQNAESLPEAMVGLRKVLALRKHAQKVPYLVKDELGRLGLKLGK